MRAVNLLPLEARYRKRWWAADAVPASPRRILASGGALAAVLLISLAAAYMLQKSIVEDRETTLAGLEVKVAAAEAEAAVIRAQQDSAKARLDAFVAVTSSRVAWEKVLRELAQVLPPNVYLQTLNVAASSPTAAAAAAASGTTTTTAFNIVGSTTSQDAVALVLERLALLPWISGVTLASSVRSGDDGLVNFTISATFNSTGSTG